MRARAMLTFMRGHYTLIYLHIYNIYIYNICNFLLTVYSCVCIHRFTSEVFLNVYFAPLRLHIDRVVYSAVMALMTRSMTLKTSSDAGEPVVVPLKIMKSPVPSSSGSSSRSSSPSSYVSPRKLPTPLPKTSFICEVCRNTSSSLNSNSINVSSSFFPNVKLNEFDRQINLLLNNLECKNELISNQISRIESAISGHKAIVNALERGNLRHS